MYIERAMTDGETLELNLRIVRHENGLYTIYMNGDESALEMLGEDEVDETSIGEILRCLYDKAYGTDNPRFDTSGESPLYCPENPVTIPAKSYLTIAGFGQVRSRDALIIWPDGTLSTEGCGDD